MIRVLSIEEAYDEHKNLLCCLDQNTNNTLFNYLILSSYYQQLLLCGYSVQEIIEEFLFPTQLLSDCEEIYKIIKSLRLKDNLAALTDAVCCLKSIGYIAQNGLLYKIEDIECPMIIEDYALLMKKKDVNKGS